MIDLQEMIYKTFYARWDENKKRRENWDESVDRFADFFRQRCPEELQEEFNKAIELFRRKEIVPSMRAFWSAGKPLQKENAMAYNCAFTTIETIKDFPTILYLLMCGCGVGFSVEKKLVEKLPEIPVLFESDETIVVSDSREGWAEAYYIILKRLFSGEIPNYDLSKIRKKGERLKTSGGRASGGDVLGELIEETFKIFRAASEEKRKLSPIECHDLVCSIAKCVVAGGTRRSACISLSDLGDTEMRRAKEGQFWVNHPNRSNSNNSAIYEKKPSPVDFIYEMYSMIRSQSGERGIFNRGDLKTTLPERRDKNHVFGINPCGEAVLRRAQFCNLSEVIIREKDSLEYLKEKIRAATLIGLLQSTLTNFKFISSEWKKNCEEERLIGVSLTGIKDHEILRTISDETAFYARELKNESLKSAEEFSKIMKVNMPAQVTVIKPSGTTSQLVNSSSGIHPRFSKYYIRRVTVSKMDPIYQFLKSSGCPFYEDDNSEMSPNALVEFPVKAPDSAESKDEKGAIEQLEHWKIFKTEYCEGNPSATIFVSDSEWIDVVQWVYKNWEHIIGLSFFPKDDNIYPNAPFKEISEEEYEERLKLFPKINWNELEKFENSDNTKGQREFACAGGKCEL